MKLWKSKLWNYENINYETLKLSTLPEVKCHEAQEQREEILGFQRNYLNELDQGEGRLKTLRLWRPETLRLWKSETLKLKLWNFLKLWDSENLNWRYKTLKLWLNRILKLWNSGMEYPNCREVRQDGNEWMGFHSNNLNELDLGEHQLGETLRLKLWNSGSSAAGRRILESRSRRS